ncbi:hypothetical protein HDU97_000159 [Phlyctochytrium planicorne]|nr:hypothetical protein HDU97_000159 [Phlyctochytrium planicorne]
MSSSEPPPGYATVDRNRPGRSTSTTINDAASETAPLLISSSSSNHYNSVEPNRPTTIPPTVIIIGPSHPSAPASANPESPGPPPYTILDDNPGPENELPTYADVADTDPSDEDWLEMWGGWIIFTFFILLVLSTVAMKINQGERPHVLFFSIPGLDHMGPFDAFLSPLFTPFT